MAALADITSSGELTTGWWGNIKIAHDQTVLFRIGPLDLSITRTPNEFLIRTKRMQQQPENLTRCSVDFDARPLEGGSAERCIFRETPDTITLMPALADRWVVSQPSDPLFITPEEEVTLFVSSIVWVRIFTRNSTVLLRDLPVIRPSDTWYPPNNPLDGQLCYSARTAARLNPGLLPRRPFRAVTPLKIKNKSSLTLPIERVAIPVPNLAIYQTANGQLVTQSVDAMSVERERGRSLVEVDLGKRPSSALGETTKLAEARGGDRNVILRAFDAFFE